MMMHRKGNEHSQGHRHRGDRSHPRSMMMHHKGNERSQGHRNTDRLALPRSYPYRRIPTQENTALPLATTDTGDRLAPVARPCWLSPHRSMMMHHKGNEHSQAYSLTGSYHCRQRRTGTQGHRQGRHPRSCCSLLLALALSLYDDAPQRK